MKFGFKQKIIALLVAILTLMAALNAMLSSWLSNQQGERAAYSDLDRNLITWDKDLQGQVDQTHNRALAVLGDAAVMQQVADVVAFNVEINDPVRRRVSAEMAKSLGYVKSVSLNQLDLAMRTGGFSSIAVYAGDELSHFVSEAGAGMRVPGAPAGPVWLTTTATGDSGLPVGTWPAWNVGGAPPTIARKCPDLKRTTVSFAFLPQGDLAIDVSVPIVGDIDRPPTALGLTAPYFRFVSQIGIAGRGRTSDHAVKLATMVFRKTIRAADLRDLADKTGKIPYIISLDGMRRVAPVGVSLLSGGLLKAASNIGGSPTIVHQMLWQRDGSAYADAKLWLYSGSPRFLLVLTSSRAHTLSNIREAVWAIVIVSAAITVLSIGLAVFWIGRFVDPIIALTHAVKRIKLRADPIEGASQAIAAADLRPIEVRAPDEIGDLAAAFNLMIAELGQSLETLEQRVQDRTAELRQQTRYLQTLLDQLPLRVWLKDIGGRYLAVNQATAAVAGLSPDAMIGRSFEQFWTPEEVAAFRAADDATIATRQRKITEREDRTGVGDERSWTEILTAPVLDEDGSVLGIVGVGRDISAQKALDAAREAALDQAVRLARARSDFLAQMSHELRTPLNAILGYTQLLQDGERLTERQARGLATIRSSGTHLLTLIDEILDLARSDAAKLELHPEDIKLPAFLRVVTDIIRIKAEEKSLLFVCELTADLPTTVQVDGKRLRQVLLNLLGNAVKFTDGGRVVLRVMALPANGNGQSSSRDGALTTGLRFEVEDTGIGMSADQVARIFHPFTQVAEVIQRREGGAGLGLAISRELIRLMGGDVQVQSELGKGSLFWFELDLPVAAREMDVVAAPRNVIGYEGQRKKILVVDDVAPNRAMLIDVLTPLGFQVVGAADGREGLEAAERERPDLIVMDVMMPVMDGVEAMGRIRQTPTLARTPIIAVSASATKEQEIRSFAAGANAFLSKPIDRDIMTRMVGDWLGLTWIYEGEPSEQVAIIPASADALVIPPEAEMEVLHNLAMAGNMRNICVRANYLEGLDPIYKPFAERLRNLAEGYHTKAITTLVERYIAAGGDAAKKGAN